MLTKESVMKAIVENIQRQSHSLSVLHEHWRYLHQRADREYEVANTEQWEAYMESIEYVERKLLSKYRRLARLKERLTQLGLSN